MQAVILAGGTQSTLSDEREGIPKPMIELGGKPLLWHIMKRLSKYGLKEFVICGGYRIDKIKEYFKDFYIYQSDITVDLAQNTIEVHKNKTEDWKVTVVDTGLYSGTGQRISKIENYIEDEDFLVTYGDCLSDINYKELIDVHSKEKKKATITLAKPSGRNQLIPIDSDGEIHYTNQNKTDNDGAWINGDCFIFNRSIFGYLRGNYDLERQLMQELSKEQELSVYRHYGYWTAVETKRELQGAENLWNAGIAPWKVFD